MDIMSVLNVPAMGIISALALAITQYVKASIPEKAIPYANILAGVVAAFLYFYKPGTPIDYIPVIVNGVLGAVGADLGFDFLSVKKSPMFTLSSKPEAPPKPKKEEKPAVDPILVEAVRAAIAKPASEVKQ